MLKLWLTLCKFGAKDIRTKRQQKEQFKLTKVWLIRGVLIALCTITENGFCHTRSHETHRTDSDKHRDVVKEIVIQHIVKLPKYGHGELNIRRPHTTDILRYT